MPSRTDFMCTQSQVEDGTLVIRWSGALRVWKAAQMRAVMLDALSCADHVCVDLTDATEADVTLVQLLCSSHRTAEAQGKRVTLAASSPAIQRLVECLGMKRKRGCRKDCLWRDGGE